MGLENRYFSKMPLKVLMLGWELPPFNSGGLGVACYGLAKALSKKGIQITFVLPMKVDLNVDFMELVFADIQKDLEKIPAAYSSSPWLAKLKNGVVPFPRDFLAAAEKYAEKIKDIALKSNPDIIHAHDWMTYPAAIEARKVTGKPLVAHVHSTEFDRTGGHNPNPIVYEIEKEGLQAADRVLPVGGFMKNILVSKYSLNPQKIVVVYNGIDEPTRRSLAPGLSEFKKLGYKIVLYLGRITLQKGPEYFVRAAKRVSEYDPKVVFVVTGSGDMQEYMISEAARLGVLGKFIFTGFLRGDERDQIYQSADLYVMPSVSEPFGITALEAVANGTPVLISKQSGVSEILENALKVDFWDTEEMANKILAVLKYNPLKVDLRSQGGREIKNITWEKAADKCFNIYNQLTT